MRVMPDARPVKERLVDYVAVRLSHPGAVPPILCLVRPPERRQDVAGAAGGGRARAPVRVGGMRGAGGARPPSTARTPDRRGEIAIDRHRGACRGASHRGRHPRPRTSARYPRSGCRAATK